MTNLNFTMSELLKSDTAIKYNIPNTPDTKSLDNLLNLIVYCLQPIREYLGKPMVISSGYRSARINQLVHGVSNSQHTLGQAADFVVSGESVASVIFKIQKSGIEYDQIINEYNRWVHISYNKGHNRKQYIQLTP